MAYTFVPSRKHDKLADNGYLYRLDRENADGTTSWRCDQKVGQNSCKGRVKTDGVGGIEMITNHSCPLKPARVEVATAVAQARQRAVETQEGIRRIIAEATQGSIPSSKFEVTNVD